MLHLPLASSVLKLILSSWSCATTNHNSSATYLFIFHPCVHKALLHDLDLVKCVFVFCFCKNTQCIRHKERCQTCSVFLCALLCLEMKFFWHFYVFRNSWSQREHRWLMQPQGDMFKCLLALKLENVKKNVFHCSCAPLWNQSHNLRLSIKSLPWLPSLIRPHFIQLNGNS